MIRSCTCKHEYQDQKYGPGKRVHNPCKKGEYLRCTVCLLEKPANRMIVEKKTVKGGTKNP